MTAVPALTYVRLPGGKVTVACACGWKDPLGPVFPGPFDPLKAIVAAQAAHPRCTQVEIRLTPNVD